MRTMIWFSLAVFLALVLAIEGAGLARGACVYNNAEYPIYVNLYFGSACSNNWTIHRGTYKCQEGMGGKVWVRVMDPFNDHEISDGYCVVEVGDHGWVGVYQDGKKITVKSKHKGGSVIEECTTKIVRD